MRLRPALLSALLALSACQAGPVVSPSPSPSPAASPSVDPCASVSPVPAGTMAIALDGWEAFAGLADPRLPDDLPVTLRVSTVPGSAATPFYRYVVRYRVTRPSGTAETAPATRHFDYVGTFAAGDERRYSPPAKLLLQLPIAELKPLLVSADRPTAIEAVVRLTTRDNVELKGADGQAFEARLPLSLTDAAAPALASRLAACAMPTPSPSPWSVEPPEGDRPRVADWVGLNQSGSLRYTGGTLTGTPLEAILKAPPGSAGAVVKSVTVRLAWTTAAGAPAASETTTLPLPAAVVVAPAQDTAYGPAATVPLPIDTAGLTAAADAGVPMAVVHFEFLDERGYGLLDKNFQNLAIEVPIALR